MAKAIAEGSGSSKGGSSKGNNHGNSAADPNSYVGGAGQSGQLPNPPASTGQATHGTPVSGPASNAGSAQRDSAGRNTAAGEKYINGAWHYVNADGEDLGAVGGVGGSTTTPTPYKTPYTPYSPYGSGASTAMTQYEKAQVALDKQRLADQEAQQKADQQYRESQSMQTSNKDFQDYQSKHYYGSMNGMPFAAPAGAASFYKMPEPADLKAGYADKAVNTGGAKDPWTQGGPTYNGYSGEGFSNAQHAGMQPTGNVPVGATPAPIAPDKGGPPPVQGMAGGGQVPGQPGQPQLEVLHAGEQVVPGENLDPNAPNAAPSPVANAGPDKMNPIIRALLQAVNGIITSPEFQSAVYSSGGPQQAGGDMPPSAATGGTALDKTLGIVHGGEDIIPAPGQAPTNGSSPSGSPGLPTPGVPNPAQTASPNQPLPASYPPGSTPPIGNTSGLGGGTGYPGQVQPWHTRSGAGISPIVSGSPISQAQATLMSGVIPGPMNKNHVPYGPELTGLSGYGGLITPDGTPVPISMWQKSMLDPTSIANYEDYVGSIAGWNPQDIEQAGARTTGGQMPDLKAPTHFTFPEVGLPPAGG